jgi:phosphoribosylglycinamide formyltransferase-1
MERKRTAILISGRGSNMASLISAAQAEGYPAEIVLVVSNRPHAKGLEVAQAAGITTEIVDHVRYEDRVAFDAALDQVLQAHAIDLVCLAGFLRMLTPKFVEQWRGRMINVHPALLPQFKGLDTHARALAAGVKTHGATVHFVSAEVDSGPIIMQASVPVHVDDTEASLAARVLAQEHRIYPEALRLVAEGRASMDHANASEPAE